VLVVFVGGFGYAYDKSQKPADAAKPAPAPKKTSGTKKRTD
jgi:hypothetical protein